MKKLFAGLVATIMMIGLVSGLTGGAATADAKYPASVPTTTKVDSPGDVQKGNRARIGVKVVPQGDVQGSPRGTVVLIVERNAGGYTFKDSKSYDGGWITFRTGQLTKRGSYSITAKYRAKDGSKWIDSRNDDGSFRVVR